MIPVEMTSLKERIYTRAQRDALLRAVVIDGLTVAEACRRANAGELPGIDAFRVPYGSASDIVRKDRETFQVRALADIDHAREVLEADTLRLAGYAHITARAIEKQVLAGETPDPTAVKKAAEAVTAVRRALGPAPRKPLEKTETEKPASPAADDVVTELLKHAEPNGHHYEEAATL